jgi:hypothetical protein
VTAAPLHVHCGDCAAAVATRADLPGTVLAWRDSSAVGPCSVDDDAHRRARATWRNVAPTELQIAADLPDDRDLILWFGPDPWEQVALIEVLAGAPPAHLSIAPLARGVGLMAPADLHAPFAARQDAGDLVGPMRTLWHDFRADHRPALRAWTERFGRDARLPHLASALRRVLEDRDQDRTTRQVAHLVAEGVTEVSDLMRRLRDLETPQHGVWYGDTIVTRLRDAALAARR